MRPLRFHVLRFLEWLADRDVAWANAHILATRDWRNRRVVDAERHGSAANAMCPPASAAPEWHPRLWARDHDARSDDRGRP